MLTTDTSQRAVIASGQVKSAIRIFSLIREHHRERMEQHRLAAEEARRAGSIAHMIGLTGEATREQLVQALRDAGLDEYARVVESGKSQEIASLCS